VGTLRAAAPTPLGRPEWPGRHLPVSRQSLASTAEQWPGGARLLPTSRRSTMMVCRFSVRATRWSIQAQPLGSFVSLSG
jgi:hypothetical protein